MGNYRFRLSDMIPNAWFYKLKDMSTKSKTHNYRHRHHHSGGIDQTKKRYFQNSPSSPPLPSPRQSYYFSSDSREKLFGSPVNPKVSDTQFPDSPRKPRKRSHGKRRGGAAKSSSSSKHHHLSSSVSAGCNCRAKFDSVWQPEALPDNNSLRVVSAGVPAIDPFDNSTTTASWSSSCSCRIISSSTADLVIDMETTERSFNRKVEVVSDDDEFSSMTEPELPPILTKPPKFNDLILDLTDEAEEPRLKFGVNGAKSDEKTVRSSSSHRSVSVKFTKEQKSAPVRRTTGPASQGLRIRTYSNSPRLASKKIQAYNRRATSTSRKKSLTESFAVVKSSFDPQKDFRDSMVEMIVENNIRNGKDLEDLLACYLSLNSSKYHGVIVKVFEQIWFDLTEFRL